MSKNPDSFIKLLILIVFSGITCNLRAQNGDSSQTKASVFGGAVTVQTKGISTIPNLTLGKPAAIFDLKVGRKLTFEPQFRFSLKGKPWAMVFWWRYNPTVGKKFSLNFSANTSLSFKDIRSYADTITNTSSEIIRTTRYMAAAIAPNYRFNKYLGVGMYLFYTRGIEKFITQNTWMISVRPTVSNIPLAKNVVAGIGPDIYYLKMDEQDGWYLTSRFTISKKNFPLSISALINKTLNSTIPADYDFLWNLGLTYAVNREYVRK